MKEYTLRVYPEGEGQRVSRTLSICDIESLDILCGVILDSFSFDHSHLYAFFATHPLTSRRRFFPEISEMEENSEKTLGDLNLEKDQKFYLHYDFGDDWVFVIRVVSWEEVESKRPPEVLKQKGELDQYGQDVEAWEEMSDDEWEEDMEDNKFFQWMLRQDAAHAQDDFPDEDVLYSPQDMLKIDTYFAEDIYATQVTGAEIQSVGTKMSIISLEILDNHRNAMGNVMGAVYYTLADFAGAVAANSEYALFEMNKREGVVPFGPKPVPCVTTTGNITFLQSAKGNLLVAICNEVRSGKHTAFYEVTVLDEEGNECARVQLSGQKLVY